MTQDTRKDPRAKVLTMTVRYKSATLDEFIEHHSHDVSRGGMFIKTPSPFPAGTLLKFEVKIAAEQRVMQGVGRVVWKREASDANDVRPAGMGVKFIKIDDDSRKVIDQLVDARGEAQSNFEDGAAAEPAAAARGSSAPQKETPVATPLMPSTVAAPRGAQRKSTMIGLGSMGSTPSPGPAQPKAESTDAFFPKTELDMPAPEDRTVMKQAAELLQDALREAGGSLEEVGTPIAPAAGRRASSPSLPAPESKRSVVVEAEKPAAPASKPEPARAAVEPARAALAATAPATRSVAVNVPKARVAPAQASPASSADGGGKFVLAFAAVAVVGGIVYFASQKEPPAAPPAEPAAEQAPPPVEATPPPAPEPAAVAPSPAPEPAPSAAPSAAAAPEPSAAAAASAVPSAPPAKALAPAPVVAAPKPAAPKPVVRQQPRPKPAPAAAPSEPTTPPAAAEPPAEKPAPVEKPPAAEKPAPAPKPAPAKKPAPADGDNPY